MHGDDGARLDEATQDDVDALWEYVLDGTVDWVVSDHACCRDEMKFGAERDDVFVAKSGFGGTEYLLAGLVSEGTRRDLTPQRIAQLISSTPARRYGLRAKGDLAVGFELTAKVTDTFLRGNRILENGKVIGEPTGRYLARPTS